MILRIQFIKSQRIISESMIDNVILKNQLLLYFV